MNEQPLESAFSDILAAVKVVEVEEVLEEREVVRDVTEERRSCTFAMEVGDLGSEAFLEAGSVELGGESLLLDADDGWTIIEAELACPNQFPGYAR